MKVEKREISYSRVVNFYKKKIGYLQEKMDKMDNRDVIDIIVIVVDAKIKDGGGV